MIDLESLTVKRGGRTVLQEICASFRPGVTALVGRNGAGKTTLLLAILGMIEADAGQVRVEQEDILSSARARRRFHSTLGWVPQEVDFPLGVRVREAVEYSHWLKALPAQTLDSAVTEALESADLMEFARARARSLSGGQRRRLALACAVVGRPRFLILDEPTAGLDPHQRRHFLEAVQSLATSSTVILSTHLVEDILHVAEHMVALTSGRIGYEGPLRTLVPADSSYDIAAGAIEAVIAPGEDRT